MATTTPIAAGKMTREEIIRKQKQYIFPAISTYFSEPLPLERGHMEY